MIRNVRGEMPFLDHLEELRWRILWSLLAIIVGSIVGFILVLRFGVLDILINPFYEVMGEEERLVFLSPTEPFFLILRVGILGGVVLVSPILIYQVWAFLSPALERHEKRAIIPALYMGVVLFSLGVWMSYAIALPVTLRFLLFFDVFIRGEPGSANPAFPAASDRTPTPAIAGVDDTVLRGVTLWTAHQTRCGTSADLLQQLLGKLRRATVRIGIDHTLEIAHGLIELLLENVDVADPIQRYRNPVRSGV